MFFLAEDWVLIGFQGNFYRIPVRQLKSFEVTNPKEKQQILEAVNTMKVRGRTPSWMRELPETLVAGVRG
jgi:hypothetical protein